MRGSNEVLDVKCSERSPAQSKCIVLLWSPWEWRPRQTQAWAGLPLFWLPRGAAVEKECWPMWVTNMPLRKWKAPPLTTRFTLVSEWKSTARLKSLWCPGSIAGSPLLPFSTRFLGDPNIKPGLRTTPLGEAEGKGVLGLDICMKEACVRVIMLATVMHDP